MKITFETTDYEDEAKIRRMINADGAYRALHEIANEIFRPARKHGYPDQTISDLLNSADVSNDAGTELIGALEEKFYELLRENKVDLDDY